MRLQRCGLLHHFCVRIPSPFHTTTTTTAAAAVEHMLTGMAWGPFWGLGCRFAPPVTRCACICVLVHVCLLAVRAGTTACKSVRYGVLACCLCGVLCQVRLPVRCAALLQHLLDCLKAASSHKGLRAESHKALRGELYVCLLQYLHFCR